MNHTTLLFAVGCGVTVLALFTLASGRRRAREAALYAEQAGRTVSLFGRVLVTAGTITGAQFAVIRYAHNNISLLLAALALPALLAAVPVVRALTMTSHATTRRGYRR